MRDLSSVAQIKDIKLHEILVDYDHMLHASETVLKGIQETWKLKQVDSRYEEDMRAAEKIILRNQLLLQTTEDVLADKQILNLPDV